jgi:hypothetical protein
MLILLCLFDSGKAGKYGSSGSCSPCPANYFWCERMPNN